MSQNHKLFKEKGEPKRNRAETLLFTSLTAGPNRLTDGGGERGRSYRAYLSLHCLHQNDPCVMVGSDENDFNVSLLVRDKVTRQCLQTTTFLKRRESRTEALPLKSLNNAFTARPNHRAARLSNTPSIAFRHLPPRIRKPVLGVWPDWCGHSFAYAH